MAAKKMGDHSELEAKPPIRAVPHFFLKFFSFFQVFQVKPNFFLPITSTLLPTHKFEIIICNPRNDFYALLQNLNKNGQKSTRKKYLGKKFGPYCKSPRSTILKWIKNTHSDNYYKYGAIDAYKRLKHATESLP